MTNLPEEVSLAAGNSPERYLFGEIEVKSVSDTKMQMSGFVSTPRVDLATEVVEVDSFDKYFDFYKRNPIYCYNHDKTIPIGRVENPQIVKSGAKTGLYLDNITLSPIPIVKELLWPLVLDKVLTQQSIGFLSLKGAMEGRVYHHKEVYMLESSLVPIACNPEATIDTIKSVFGALPEGYEQFETLSDLIGAYDKGLLKLPSEVRRVFSMAPLGESNMPILDSTKSEATVPDFADAVVLSSVKTAYDPEGDEKPKPHRNEKGYVPVCEMIHAAKSETRGSYLFQIAVPTEKGFKYDWKHLSISMSRILGGNGGAHFNSEQKSAIIERIAEGYAALGKELPVVKYADGDVKVSSLKPDLLEGLDYKSIEFKAGEPEVVKIAYFVKDVNSVIDALTSFKKDGAYPEEVKEVVKRLHGYVDISIFTSVNDPEAVSFMTMLLNTINEFVTGNNEDNGEYILMSGPEGMRKFAAHLMAKADEMEAASTTSKSLEIPEENVLFTVKVDQLKELFDACSKLTGQV